MATLEEMFLKITSSSLHDRMTRSVSPFCNYFNINQLYYTKIFSSGYFMTIGTHLKLHEYLFSDVEMMQKSPVLRQSSIFTTGVTLLKNTSDPRSLDFFDMSWKKFRINFALNIQKRKDCIIECFGFGVNSNLPTIDGLLLNELPLIYKFMDYFLEENKQLIDLAEDNRVKINTNGLDNAFKPIPELISHEKAGILRQLGLDSALLLTARELDVLKYLAHGYPASCIAKKLFLSTRTVEHHISSIKFKLECDSREKLLEKAYEISLIIHLERI